MAVRYEKNPGFFKKRSQKVDMRRKLKIQNNESSTQYIIKLMKSHQILQFAWMQVDTPGVSCRELHPNTSCLEELVVKYLTVMKGCAKFYFVLHFIPFLIFKLRKIKDKKSLKTALWNFIKRYLGSVNFMAALVGINKSVLCVNNNICGNEHAFDGMISFLGLGKVFWWGSFFASLSLFFEEDSRKEQIAFFVFIRALRSIFTAIKRRGLIYIPQQESFAFILIFGIISYLFYHQPKLLKHQNMYEAAWGKA